MLGYTAYVRGVLAPRTPLQTCFDCRDGGGEEGLKIGTEYNMFFVPCSGLLLLIETRSKRLSPISMPPVCRIYWVPLPWGGDSKKPIYRIMWCGGCVRWDTEGVIENLSQNFLWRVEERLQEDLKTCHVGLGTGLKPPLTERMSSASSPSP